MTSRPPVPEPMKRAIRQRCGFGCVICGYPLYEYDHMKRWSSVQEHQEKDITLLCLNHHREVTNGLLSRNAVEKANSNPFLLQKGISKPYFLNYAGVNLITELGGNTFHGTIPLMIDDQAIIKYQSDGENLLLCVKLFNEKGDLILDIDANELVYSVNPWDIELVGNQLTLRTDRRKFLIRMKFIVPNKLLIDRGILRYKEHSITIQDQEIVINGTNTIMRGCHFKTPIGIAIGKHTQEFPCAIHIN